MFPINEVTNIEELSRNILECLGSQIKLHEHLEICDGRWKSQYLSLGARVTLMNSVLDALPTYMMSIFPFLDGIIQWLDKVRRDFLWEGNTKTD